MYDVFIKHVPGFGELRCMVYDGKVYVCGSDIATMLGFKNPINAIHRHCKNSVMISIKKPGGNRYGSFMRYENMRFIPESDLHHMIMHSRLKNANVLEEWIEKNILPNVYLTKETKI